MNETTGVKPGKKGVLPWLRKRLAALAGLVLAIAIFVVVGWLYLRNPHFFDNFKAYGYLGVFVVSVILNATIIIPVSNMTMIAAFGAALPLPWLVGIIGGLGGGIGEMAGYVAGRSGRALLAKNKFYRRVEGWVKKWGVIAVFIFSIVPFAFDVVGIIAGAMRMPMWKFFVATWLGRTIFYVVVAYLGVGVFETIFHWLFGS
jgi:membrane protein DedA with SNARE-associated domain